MRLAAGHLATFFNKLIENATNSVTGLDTLGFSASGNFDRSAWGLSAWWPAAGNDVHVPIQAEFTKSGADPRAG